jgi:metal-dependent amidase/aminoacylase/carboxypeptidase family protein
MTWVKALLFAAMAASCFAQDSSTAKEVDAVYPEAYALDLDLHQNPELSSHETRTAAKLAGQLRALGYDVTEHISGTGIVAILKNGSDPTVILRTELDALPVEEKTGLPYESKVRTKDESGRDVPVIHACGHDLHMASLLGTAAVMAHSKDSWHGTLMLIGQPAEETTAGAKKMIDDGLLKRFPKPDVGVALHVGNDLPAGTVGIAPGYSYASADSVRITIYGKGGHGAAPQNTVELGLTIRTYKPEVRKQILTAIARITKAEAEAAGAPREPSIEEYESTDAVYNDPALAQRLKRTLEGTLAKDSAVTAEPLMVSEDYAYFVEQGIPSFYFALGGAEPQKYAAAKIAGTKLPFNHSSLFAPDVDPALHTGIAAEVVALRDLLNASPNDLYKLRHQQSNSNS